MKVERVTPKIIHDMTDEEFFIDDPEDRYDYVYDEIVYWYEQKRHRPIVHTYEYRRKSGQWESWAEYCYEAACRDNPLALAKYAYFCEHGIGCEQNLKTAIECYERGAELGEIHCIRAMDRIEQLRQKLSDNSDERKE